MHGVHEVNGTDKERKEEDRSYVVSILEILGTSAKPESITRLGNVTDNEVTPKRARPIKICMKTLEEKERVMARLANLRNADDKYKRISTKEDYSWEERQRIREWVSKAEEKNKEEQTSDWKVRGNPKKSMRLVKITRQQPSMEHEMETN